MLGISVGRRMLVPRVINWCETLTSPLATLGACSMGQSSSGRAETPVPHFASLAALLRQAPCRRQDYVLVVIEDPVLPMDLIHIGYRNSFLKRAWKNAL